METLSTIQKVGLHGNLYGEICIFKAVLWFHDGHHHALSRMSRLKFNFPEVVRAGAPCKQDKVTIVALYRYIPGWKLL
jgi:hypothetical protein